MRIWRNECKVSNALEIAELASLPDTPEYPPNEISEATVGTSVRCFSNYLKTQFVRSYSNLCNINDCFVCKITQTNC